MATAEIKTLDLNHLQPDSSFIIWDKQLGKVVKAGLLATRYDEYRNWRFLTKGSEDSIDFNDYMGYRYLVLDGRHYDKNPDEIFDLPKVPNIDIN